MFRVLVYMLMFFWHIGVFYKLGFKEYPMSDFTYSGRLLFFRATFG